MASPLLQPAFRRDAANRIIGLDGNPTASDATPRIAFPSHGGSASPSLLTGCAVTAAAGHGLPSSSFADSAHCASFSRDPVASGLPSPLKSPRKFRVTPQLVTVPASPYQDSVQSTGGPVDSARAPGPPNFDASPGSTNPTSFESRLHGAAIGAAQQRCLTTIVLRPIPTHAVASSLAGASHAQCAAEQSAGTAFGPGPGPGPAALQPGVVQSLAAQRHGSQALMAPPNNNFSGLPRHTATHSDRDTLVPPASGASPRVSSQAGPVGKCVPISGATDDCYVRSMDILCTPPDEPHRRTRRSPGVAENAKLAFECLCGFLRASMPAAARCEFRQRTAATRRSSGAVAVRSSSRHHAVAETLGHPGGAHRADPTTSTHTSGRQLRVRAGAAVGGQEAVQSTRPSGHARSFEAARPYSNSGDRRDEASDDGVQYLEGDEQGRLPDDEYADPMDLGDEPTPASDDGDDDDYADDPNDGLDDGEFAY
jgi:hypothetical protein